MDSLEPSTTPPCPSREVSQPQPWQDGASWWRRKELLRSQHHELQPHSRCAQPTPARPERGGGDTLPTHFSLCSMEGMPPCWSSIHARALQHRAVVRSDVAGIALCLKTASKTAWLILTRPWARPYPRNSAQSLCKLPTCWIQWGECLCLTLM